MLAHNKTLAAQLCSEFKEFFPENAVEYFVSYYDYYQPEAYIANTDTYIEKDSSINDEIDKLRHSATLALAERRDVIIVSSVSCIYSLGDPIDYRNMVISLRPGMEKSRDEIIKKLVEIQYERNDINFVRNKFRVRGDVLEIFPASSCGIFRRRNRQDKRDKSSDRRAYFGFKARRNLSGFPLYCIKGKNADGCERIGKRDGGASGVFQKTGKAFGGSENRAENKIRY